jgi:hypothetical protein
MLEVNLFAKMFNVKFYECYLWNLANFFKAMKLKVKQRISTQYGIYNAYSICEEYL